MDHDDFPEPRPEIDVHVDHYNYIAQHLKEIASATTSIARSAVLIIALLAYIAYKLN